MGTTARDVKADETETLTSRDRDVGFTSRDETLKFRDETFVSFETLKYKLVIATTGL